MVVPAHVAMCRRTTHLCEREGGAFARQARTACRDRETSVKPFGSPSEDEQRTDFRELRVCELRGIRLPRARVNKDSRKGRSLTPASSLLPLPQRPMVVSLLVYVVFYDGGYAVQTGLPLRLRLHRTANGEMRCGGRPGGPADAESLHRALSPSLLNQRTSPSP
jgi:hypothetical protein